MEMIVKGIWSFLSSAIERASSCTCKLGMLCVFSLMVLVSYAVFFRYVLNRPILFADEVSGYMVVFICFMGAADTLKKQRHISIDIFVRMMKPKAQVWLRVMISFMTLFILCIFFWHSIVMVYRSFTKDMHVPSFLWTPLWIPQILIPIGMFFLILQLVLETGRLAKQLKKMRDSGGKEKVERDGSHADS
jgi:TRAP-type C4-dicarboxylate transport system permease small subunit